MSRNNDTEAVVLGGIIVIFYVVLYSLMAAIVGFLFQYSLWVLFHKDIPWYGDIICGVFCSAFIVPLTVILFFLNMFGVIVAPALGG